MALTKFALQLVAPFVRDARVLAFGYPDLLVSPVEAAGILRCPQLSRTNPHGAAHKREGPMAETREAFEACGAELTCVDIAPSRGIEVVCDLNEVQHFVGAPYDLVIDAGTIEHCANVGQALMNAASAVALGGRVFHSPPLSMVNHGFYNICPTLLHDFYVQNGWIIEHMSGFQVHNGFERFDFPNYTGRYPAPSESAMYFLARRGPEARASFKWPTQTKYMRGSK